MLISGMIGIHKQPQVYLLTPLHRRIRRDCFLYIPIECFPIAILKRFHINRWIGGVEHNSCIVALFYEIEQMKHSL